MNGFVDKSDTISSVLAKTYTVLQELDAGIQKTQNTNLRYKYHENEDVLNACRRAMLAHGLMLHTQGGQVTENNKRYFQEFVFTLTDFETGEYIAFAWAGAIPCGLVNKDSNWVEDDKAVGKLKSYAIKNWLLAEFMIGTPDQDTDVNPTAYERKPVPQQPAKAESPTPVPSVKEVKIENTRTLLGEISAITREARKDILLESVKQVAIELKMDLPKIDVTNASTTTQSLGMLSVEFLDELILHLERHSVITNIKHTLSSIWDGAMDIALQICTLAKKVEPDLGASLLSKLTEETESVIYVERALYDDVDLDTLYAISNAASVMVADYAEKELPKAKARSPK